METWTLDHPEAGKLEVMVGPDVEFAAAYESWPQQPSEQEYTALDANMPLKERIRAFINNPPIRVQICRDGEVLGRYTSLSSARVALKQIDTDELRSLELVNRTKPHLKLHANALDELIEVTYHNGSEVVEFEPPAGSRGARRREAMEQSPVKRVTYPSSRALVKAVGRWLLSCSAQSCASFWTCYLFPTSTGQICQTSPSFPKSICQPSVSIGRTSTGRTSISLTSRRCPSGWFSCSITRRCGCPSSSVSPSA